MCVRVHVWQGTRGLIVTWIVVGINFLVAKQNHSLCLEKSHFLCQLESDIQNQDKSSVLIFFFFTSVEHHMKGNSNYELKNTDQ